MNSIKDDLGIWFELNRVCDLLSLAVLEVLYSRLKEYIPSEFLRLKNDVLYINSFGFLLLSAYDRSGRASMTVARQYILDAIQFWSGINKSEMDDSNDD